jgi:hypothetical protein
MSEAIITAAIKLLPTVTSYRASGWRGVCRFDSIVAADGSDVFGIAIDLLGRNRLEPGETAECRLRLWASDALPGRVVAGTRIVIFEGVREVARGEVVSFTQGEPA